jgi:hypothetical protein
MRLRLALLAVLAAAGPTAAAAQAREPSATIVSYGRYEIRQSGKPEKAERTAYGSVQPVEGHRLLERTDVIVGQLGNTYCVELKFENFVQPVAALTIRTRHPPLTNPKTGKTTSVSEYDWTVATYKNAHFCSTFVERWGIAEGPSTVQILYAGRVIAEKTFKIVVPLN